MTLSLREKSAFYRELGQLLRSGKPFPASVQLLESATRGAVRKLLALLKAAVDSGSPVDEAFAAQYPRVSHLEASVIGAGARSGRLDQGCAFLSEYFAELDAARKSVIRKLLYPLFLLHFAAFINGLPQLVLTGNGIEYLKGSLGVLLLIYLCCIALWLLVSMVLFEGARRPGVDRLLRMIPIFGKMRRAFALSRFCATYEMQLQSGVNVMDSLASAGTTSQSALVKQVVDRAIPLVRTGAQVGPQLAGSDAFTQDMVRSFMVGEETGNLDEELKRMTNDFQTQAMSLLDLLGGVFAKGIYFLIMAYAAYLIITGYLHYFSTINKMVE